MTLLTIIALHTPQLLTCSAALHRTSSADHLKKRYMQRALTVGPTSEVDMGDGRMQKFGRAGTSTFRPTRGIISIAREQPCLATSTRSSHVQRDAQKSGGLTKDMPSRARGLAYESGSATE